MKSLTSPKCTGTKKSAIQGFSFLQTYHEEKNKKREKEKRLNHQAQMAFTTPAAVEEIIKNIIVAYFEKNEQAASCLLERK